MFWYIYRHNKIISFPDSYETNILQTRIRDKVSEACKRVWSTWETLWLISCFQISFVTFKMSTTLAEYYSTNYTKCYEKLQEFSFLSSPNFLKTSAIVEFIVIIPINLFGFYCIFVHSPKYMKEFKWHLFHLQFWYDFLFLIIQNFSEHFYVHSYN